MKIEKEKCLIVRSQLSIPLHFISIVCLLPTVRAWQISHVCSSWYSTFFQREVEKSTHTNRVFFRLHFGTKNKGSRPNAISELIFWFASFHSAVPVRIRNEILVCLCEVIDTSGWLKKKKWTNQIAGFISFFGDDSILADYTRSLLVWDSRRATEEVAWMNVSMYTCETANRIWP